MKQRKELKTTTRAGLRDKLREFIILSMCALLALSPELQAAKPGGVPVLLPPFIPTLPPINTLYPVSPFAMTGFIQSATVDTPSDVLSGGKVTINGIQITVPRNTILQMPVATMTWQEVFANAPEPWKTVGQTGLALNDTPKPLSTFEFTVQGNRVVNSTSDEYIAGLIFISQQSLNTSQGYINGFDYSKGVPEILVSKTFGGPTGARIRVNTPAGRYGTPDPNADIRFGADEDNPTIAARNGFPMCVPRSDPKVANDAFCPQWNRPLDPLTGAYSTNFTMPDPGTKGFPDPSVPNLFHQNAWPAPPALPSKPPVTPDAFEQAPFEIGDYITYSGTLSADPACTPAASDPTSCQYISAHTIIAEIAAQTAPGTWPVYTRMDEFRILLGGTPNPIFPQEDQEKIFGDSFTTDYSQLVDEYAVDVDPCAVDPATGLAKRTHRFYLTADPFGPPLGGLKGRARFRATIGNFLPGTREMAIVSRSLTGGMPIDTYIAQHGGVLPKVANGIGAGKYQAPQFEFIFPENLIIGSQQIPLTFEQLPFLVNGSGMYQPIDGSAPVKVGPITPFPNVSQPVANCTTGFTFFQPPVANAGAPKTVASGATVTLDGSASTDPQGLTKIYTWIQSGGPTLPSPGLLNSDKATPSFQAPVLPAGSTPQVLTFQLAVCNGFTCGGISSVNVTVMPSPGAPTIALAADNRNPAPGARVTLSAAPGGGTAPLGPTVFRQTAGPVQALTIIGNTATFNAILPPGTATPATLTFTASVTDSALPVPNTSVATINLYAGADTISVTNVVYALSKSRLQVAMTDNALPKGAATITVTPLVNGVPIAAGIIATYDPGVDGYNVSAAIVNPIPDSVRITSNYGFAGTFPITRIR